MGQQKGSTAKVLMDFEDTFGAAPSVPAAIVLKHNGFTPKATRPKNQPGTMTGSRNPAEPFDGFEDVPGDLTVPVDSRQFGYILRGCFGVPTTTDLGDGLYSHVFKIGDTQPSMIFESQFLDLAVPTYAQILGSKFSSLGIEFGGDGELVAKLGLMACHLSSEAASFDTAPTAAPFNRLNNFQTALEEGGASYADATMSSIQLDFGLDGETYCIGGGGVRSALNEGGVKVSGSVTALFKTYALLDKAKNSTESSLKWTVTRGTHSLAIEVPELQYEYNSPAVDGPAGIKIDQNFIGYYADGSAASAVVVTLTNDISSYADA